MIKYFLVIKDNIVTNTIKCSAPYVFPNQIGTEYEEYDKIQGAAGIGWIKQEDGSFLPPEEIIEPE